MEKVKFGRILRCSRMAALFLGASLAFTSCEFIQTLIMGKDTQAPSVVITSPAAGASLTGTVTLSANADDESPIFRVVFYVDGIPLANGEDRTKPYAVQWDTATAAAGQHSIYAVAYDDAGNDGQSSTVLVTVVGGAGGSYAEDFEGYPLGATGSLSPNMPVDASWAGMTMDDSTLTIVADPAGGAKSPTLRLANGNAEADVSTFVAAVPSSLKGEVEFDVYIESAFSPGALCVSLGSGNLYDETGTNQPTTAFFLWLVDTEDGNGTSAAWFKNGTTVQFGETEITKGAWHRLRVVYDCAGSRWGTYLDDAVLVTSQTFAQAVDAVEYLSISTMGLSAAWFGGAFLVDGIETKSDPLVVIPPADGGGTPSVTSPATLGASADATGIALSWTDSSDNEDGFMIMRGTTAEYSGETWDGIDMVGSGVVSYLDDSALTPGSTYYYMAVAYATIETVDYFGMSPIASAVAYSGGGGGGGLADGVYVAGTYTAAGGLARAVIWHDDGATVERIDLTDGATAAKATDVCVADDFIYVSGWKRTTSSSSSSRSAVYWRIDGSGTVTETTLQSGAGVTYGGLAQAIAVADGVVWVAGEDWQVEGVRSCVWRNGTRTYLHDEYDGSYPIFSTVQDISVFNGTAFIAGNMDNNSYSYDHIHYWAFGQSVTGVAAVDLVGAYGNTSYGSGIALDSSGVIVSGDYNDGSRRAAVWRDDGSYIGRTLLGPSGMTSYANAVGTKTDGTVLVAGYYQIEGTLYSAALWTGTGSSYALTDLPRPASGSSAYAEDMIISGGVAYIAGSWTDATGTGWLGYWTSDGVSTGRKAIEGGTGSASCEAIAVRNPVPDTTPPDDGGGGTGGESLPAYPAGVTQSGLVAYYPFSGSVADASGTGNNGSAIGGPVHVADRFGNAGSALSFDGIDDFVLASDSDSLDLCSESWSPMTWSVWINPATIATGTKMAILFKNSFNGTNYGWGGYWLRLGNDTGIPNILADTWGYSTGRSFPVSALTANAWTHVAIVYDGNTLGLKLFINGVLSGSDGLDASYPNGYPLYIGRANNSSGSQEYWNGKLDDIRLFNRVLSDAEVAALYSEGGWPQ